ncbi:MAG: hypothetical protein AABW89_01235 [Nanoarchaeota archaeon]
MKLEKCKVTKHPEIAKEIEKLKMRGFGLRTIKSLISQEHGIEFSHQTIANYLDTKGVSMEVIIETDKSLKKEAEDWQNRYYERYKRLCGWSDDLGDMMDKLKNQLTPEEYLKYAPLIIALSKEILNQLEFIRKEQERVDNKKKEERPSNKDSLQELIKNLGELEREGIVTVNPKYRELIVLR